jgi:hypothetical protein
MMKKSGSFIDFLAIYSWSDLDLEYSKKQEKNDLYIHL